MNKHKDLLKTTCDECDSPFIKGSSPMEGLCPECSHHLYGYPNCDHKFEDSNCVKCGWNGSYSALITHLIQRHEMSDQELRKELRDLYKCLKNLPRYTEVLEAIGSNLPIINSITPLSIGLRAPEFEDSDTEMELLVNYSSLFGVRIPFKNAEPIEIYARSPLDEYRKLESDSNVRQLEIALQSQKEH